MVLTRNEMVYILKAAEAALLYRDDDEFHEGLQRDTGQTVEQLTSKVHGLSSTLRAATQRISGPVLRIDLRIEADPK